MLLKNFSIQALVLTFTFALFLNNVQAATTPVQIATGVTGVGTDSPNLLLVAQPIQNIGTATAENVVITSVNLASSLVANLNDFPMSLGDLSKDESAIVNVQFDSSPLAPGTNYRMTLNGTYQLADTGDKTYGFSVNRNVIVPPRSPGSSSIKTSSITSFTVTDPPKLPMPEALPDRVEGSRNPKRPPVPVGRFQIIYPKAFSTPLMGEQPPGGGGPASAVPKVSFDKNSPFGPNSNITPDPSGASGRTENGQGVVLTTGNTYASVSIDGGQTFTTINPFCMFGYSNCDAAGNPTGTPLVDGNLCCDQVVHYVPAINRFVWLMQTWPSGWVNGVRSVPSPIPGAPDIPLPSGTNRLRLVVVSPDDVRNWVTGAGSSWTVYDIPTATFNLTGGNDWMDYPDMSVSNNFLYVSVDKIQNNGGLIVARIPLNQLSAGGTIDIGFTDPSDIENRAHGSHLIQNPTDTMYWAGHNKTTELTVFDWPENSNIFSWREIKHNSYANSVSDYSSITPTGTDWLMGSTASRFGTENIQGAVRVPTIGICPPEGCRADEIRFAWGAGRTTNRPQPYVEVVHIDLGDFTLREQMHIWNPNFAFSYPAFSVNANPFFADVGVAIAVGGGDREAHTSVGFMQDFEVWALSNSDSSVTRYGDYLTIRKASPNEMLFSAVGYGRTGGRFDPHYVLFGRFCNVNPDSPSCQPTVPR